MKGLALDEQAKLAPKSKSPKRKEQKLSKKEKTKVSRRIIFSDETEKEQVNNNAKVTGVGKTCQKCEWCSKEIKTI